MIQFTSDYMEGAHPAIIERLSKTNFEKNIGYGCDSYCDNAIEKIRHTCGKDDAEVFFLVGGTQTNALVIDAVLGKCEGVLCVNTGHIATHESGAIEAWGHKVLTISGYDGKLRAKDVSAYIENFYSDSGYEHMVSPGMVYISNPTEIGTVYSYSELSELHSVCRKHNIPLFADGARLGYALAVDNYDVDMKRMAECCDIFYIGGTKVGALFGEAVVVCDKSLIKRRFTLVKKHGALLAKGWLLGLQFDTLFTDDLYLKISRNAIDKAMKLKNMFVAKGYELYIDSPTNQQFVVLPNEKLDELQKNVGVTIWELKDEHNTVVRFVTSWATTDEQLEELAAYL